MDTKIKQMLFLNACKFANKKLPKEQEDNLMSAKGEYFYSGETAIFRCIYIDAQMHLHLESYFYSTGETLVIIFNGKCTYWSQKENAPSEYKYL